MSYNSYLNSFGKVESKIEIFKENIVNSKEFVNAFLDLTDGADDVEKNSIFESIMETIECACKDNLKS